MASGKAGADGCGFGFRHALIEEFSGPVVQALGGGGQGGGTGGRLVMPPGDGHLP